LGLVVAATVSAQVYSVNVVGYVNCELKPGFNLIANPLDNKNTGDNTVGNLFGTGLPDGSCVYKYVCPAYKPANCYSTLFGWDDATMTLAPGEGAFVYIPGTASVTVTFVGDVKQGQLTTDLCKGFNMVSSQVPQAGKLQADLGYTPADGDAIYKHNKGAGYAATVTFSTLFGWDPADPDIAVAEAFWAYRETAGSWARSFTVQ